MSDNQPYVQHEGKVVETDGRFAHVMALTLDPRSGNKEGIVRCVVSRDGDLDAKGYTDRSELYRVKGDTLEKFEIQEKLNIKNDKEILKKIMDKNDDFIGFEDPDIVIDPDTSLMHLYFTIPLKSLLKGRHMKVHLGHAVGKDVDSLEMTVPMLLSNEKASAKEVSIAPINKKGFRYNLVESKDRIKGVSYSTVQVAVANDLSGPWKYGEVAFHPSEHNIPWIAGHASPGRLFPRSFIDVGEGKLLGIINGREANQKRCEKTVYKIFSVGLFIYDYENGKIDWVSPEPLIRDSEAKVITFASHFVETGEGMGILYAHVDDSFVRAYTINSEGIRSLLPKSL